MKQPISLIFTSLIILSLIIGCGGSNKSFNVFPVSKDVELGFQVASSIDEQNKKQLLDSQSNVSIYKYIYSVRDSILNNNTLVHSKDFSWRIRIIANDSVLNAFCTPGGNIYVYTGLIKFLDTEDDLAGVMGHEIAHADKRHSSKSICLSLFTSAIVNACCISTILSRLKLYFSNIFNSTLNLFL
jgi:predicted Zn-dependent protease